MGRKVDVVLMAKLFGGALCRQMVRCGKSGCKCAGGELHGPYHYLFYREGGGRLRKLYVRRAEVKAVAAASASGRARRRGDAQYRRERREQFRDRAEEGRLRAERAREREREREREGEAGLPMEERVRRKLERMRADLTSRLDKGRRG